MCNPAVPRHSFAHRFAHIFAHIFFKNNEFQKYFTARRNIFDLTQNSVVAVLTVSNLIMFFDDKMSSRPPWKRTS